MMLHDCSDYCTYLYLERLTALIPQLFAQIHCPACQKALLKPPYFKYHDLKCTSIHPVYGECRLGYYYPEEQTR